MTAFGETLRTIARHAPEAEMLIIMGTDGIPVEKLIVRPDANLEAVAAECTGLLRASLSAASETGIGDLRELSFVTDKLTAVLIGITREYFLFAALRPGAVTGRARHAMRVAGIELEREFL